MSDKKKTCENSNNKNNKTEKKKLTTFKTDVKYDLFVTEWLSNGFDATSAAKAVGFSEKSAYSQGSRLLKNVKVQEKINDALQKGDIVKQKILKELLKIATSDIKDFVELDAETQSYKQKSIEDIPDGMTSVISEIEGYRKISEDEESGENRILVTDTFKFKLYDKQKALSDYVKILGLAQPDKLDITSGGKEIPQTIFNIIGKKNDSE